MRRIQEILRDTGFDERQLEQFLALCYADFIYFAQHMMGFEIADYHHEWYDMAERHSRISIQAFRGSGKTNFFAAYFIWKSIFSAKPVNSLIVSATFEQSKMVLKIIRNMLSENDVLKHFVPEGRDTTWKATELTITNGSSFYCKPYSESVRGLRIDFLLCDEAGQYEEKVTFWTVITPVVQLNRGRIIVIGTIKSHVDLLSELYDNDEYFSVKYPSEVEGVPLWPQKYTNELEDTPTQRSLHKIRKEMGELFYMQEYLLIPISDANSLFPMNMILNCVNNQDIFLPYGKMNGNYYVGMDIAVSKTGDYTVITVLSVTNDGKRLVFAERFRGDFSERKEKLANIIDNFKPKKICFDKTGIGETEFKQLSELYSNMEGVHFTYDEKFKLILDLRHEFENYKITLPNNKEDFKTYEFTQQLINELKDFQLKVDLTNRTKTKTKFSSGKYDDCVISLSLANRATFNEYGQISIGLF